MISDERPLTLEEFRARDENGKPPYFNFFMYFLNKGLAVQIYRGSRHFMRFQAENTELEVRLTKDISSIVTQAIQTADALIPHEEELYEAYLTMHSYGIPNRTLFM